MVTRREFIQASALLGGVAIGGNSFSPLRAPGNDFAAVNPTVTTPLGKLRGRYANGVYSFKGVHYGASTEGRLRFRPPVPAKPWVGVRGMYEVGPPAPQVLGYGGFWAGLSGPGRMSEDCLVLNVWTPSLRAREKKPVMVWLHGGSYGVGSGGATLYDGANLAAKHDVVVLTINHRLNIFGYFYLHKLCGDRFADSGNAGMLDIVLALQWVCDNIAQFGGDPANVTLFGQSGGGYKISALMAMPSAQKLFHKAIIQSGSALRVDSAQEADALASKCLSQLSVSPDRIDDLIDLPADHVITTLQKMKPNPFFSFAPVVDGRSLPRQPFTPDAPVATANVPMLIGTNLNETTSLNGDFDPSSFSLDEAALRNRLKSSLHLNDESSLDALIATYQNHTATLDTKRYLLRCDDGRRFPHRCYRSSGAQGFAMLCARIYVSFRLAFADRGWTIQSSARCRDSVCVRQSRQSSELGANEKRDPPTVSRQGERSMGCFRAHGQSQPCQPASLACLRPGCPRHYASQRRVPCGERSGESRARGPQ